MEEATHIAKKGSKTVYFRVKGYNVHQWCEHFSKWSLSEYTRDEVVCNSAYILAR